MSEHRNKLSSVGPLPMPTLFTTAIGNRLLTFPRQESTITSRIMGLLCQGLRRTTYTVMLVSKSSIVKGINSREYTRRGGLLRSTRMGLNQ